MGKVGKEEKQALVTPSSVVADDFTGDGYYEGLTAGDDKAVAAAAQLFLDAEKNLNEDEDDVGAHQKAQEALEAFRKANNVRASADSLRLMVHSMRMKTEKLRWSSDPEEKEQVRETIRGAERFAKEELAKFEESGDKRAEAALMLSVAETMYDKRGDKKREEALQKVQAAQAVFRELGDWKMEANTWFVLCVIRIKKREEKPAFEAIQEALPLYVDNCDKKGEAKSRHMIGHCRMLLDEYQDAMESGKEALRIFRDLGNQKLIAFELHNLATWSLMKDKYKEALPMAREALLVFREIDYGKGWQAGALDTVVKAHLGAGNQKEALRIAEEGLQRFQDAGDRRSQVLALDTLVSTHLDKDDPDEALAVAESGLSMCKDLEDKKWESTMLHVVSQVHIRRGEYSQATQCAREAQQLFQELGNREDEAVVLGTLANINLHTDDFKQALENAAAQRELYQATGDTVQEGAAMLKQAGTYAIERKFDQAKALTQEARSLYKDMNHRRGEAAALHLMAQIHLENEDFGESLRVARKAKAIFDELKDKKCQFMILRQICQLHLGEDRPEESVRIANEARALFKKGEDQKKEVEALLMVAHANLSAVTKEAMVSQDTSATLQKGGEKAMRPAKEALTISKKLSNKGLIAASTYTVAEVNMLMGRFAEALTGSDDAGSMFRDIQDKHGEVGCVVLSAEIYYMSGNASRAEEIATRATSLARACGDGNGEQRAFKLLEKIQGPQERAYAPAPGAAAGPVVAAGGGGASAGPVVPLGMDPEVAKQLVSATLTATVGMDDSEISMDTPLMDSGLDSLSSLTFRNQLVQQSGLNLPAALMFDYPTQRALADYIVETSKDPSKIKAPE